MQKFKYLVQFDFLNKLSEMDVKRSSGGNIIPEIKEHLEHN